jgi:hypothetical protein
MLIRFALYSFAILLLILAPVTVAQSVPTEESGAQQTINDVLSDELIFEDDLFNDGLFSDAFDDTEDDKEASWLDGFTVRLSQQMFWQVNNHSVEPLPGLRIPKDAELENNRLGLNFKYQNAFAPGWLLQSTGQARWYWKDDYEYQANNDNIDSEYRINELYLQRSFSQQSIKFGRQTVVWGETVGNSVLDVINHTEFRDFTIIDIEDARLNQWMLVWDVFGNDSQWSSFINLYPEFNPTAVPDSPFYANTGYNIGDYKRGSETLFEVGTQWRKSFESSDISFMAAYLYENQLRYDYPMQGYGDAVAKKNDFILLGFSANRALGKLLLNLDLALSLGVQPRESSFPGITLADSGLDPQKNQLGASLGFEYAISNDQSISLGVQANKVLNESSGLAPQQTTVSDRIFGSWLVRYRNARSNGNLVISSTLQGDLATDSLFVSLGLDYSINDHWAVAGQIISTTANQQTPMVLFDADVRLGATVTYSF